MKCTAFARNSSIEYSLPFVHRIEEPPALRLADENHPFAGVAEVSQIGIVARVLDIEIDLEIDQGIALRQRTSLDRDAKPVAHGASAAVAAEQVACLEGLVSVGRVDIERHPVRMLHEGCEPVPVEDFAALGRGQAIAKRRLHVVLRQVDA